jgi:hypothetical protein
VAASGVNLIDDAARALGVATVNDDLPPVVR